jgi:hypothetical protein
MTCAPGHSLRLQSGGPEPVEETAAAFCREPLKLPSGLCLVLRALPTGSVTSRNPQPAEPDVVHDHIRLRQHKIVAIPYIGVCSAETALRPDR